MSDKHKKNIKLDAAKEIADFERVTKMRETSNKISTILKTSELTLKNTLNSPKEDFSQLEGELYKEAYYNIFNALKEAEPDTPDSTIHYFIGNFLNIEFKKEYDIKTREYSFIGNATLEIS